MDVPEVFNLDAGHQAGEVPGRGRPKCSGPPSWARRPRARAFQDGPPVLAILVSHPDGRWTHEVCVEKAKPCLKLRAALEPVAAHVLEPTGAAVVGVAVLRGWRCVTSAASHAQTHLMMQANLKARAFRNVAGEAFLEHAVLAVAALQSFAAVDVDANPMRAPPRVVGTRLLGHLITEGALVADADNKPVSVRTMLQGWRGRFGVDVDDPVSWTLTPLVARAMATGRWHGDVSRVAGREPWGACRCPWHLSVCNSGCCTRSGR